MSNELVINATQNGCRIALLENKVLSEFHEEEKGREFLVGDVYLGVVKKIVPGLNAAFIDVGYEKDAFLHYLDLGPQFKSLQKFVRQVLSKGAQHVRLDDFQFEKDIDKQGKISQQLVNSRLVVVQVTKEPISTKGPRLSSEISLSGRYIVLVPFSSTISVSRKIAKSEERKRLLRLIQSIKPANFGIVVRTVAEGKEVAELDRDLRTLVKKWEEGIKVLSQAHARDRIIGEVSKTTSILRDLLNESFDNIHIDDKETYEEVRSYVETIAPDREKIVKLYSGRSKIFEYYGVERQIKSAFGQNVNLKNGGYLIIEHTEALHVVDVNSGNKSNREENQENTALSVNLEATKEIARQLRLRDMGGIIVIDFIDVRNAENKKLVYDRMKEAMKSMDKAKHTILPLTRFGLMQITRERARPQVDIITKETCPTCNGSGSIKASILISDIIEKNVEKLLTQQKKRKLTLTLHPYLHAYFTKDIISLRMRWLFRYGQWVRLVKDTSLGIIEYHYFDQKGEEIKV